MLFYEQTLGGRKGGWGTGSKRMQSMREMVAATTRIERENVAVFETH